MRFRFFIKLRENFGAQIFAAFATLIFFISICFMLLLVRFQYTSMTAELENKGRLLAEGLAHQCRMGLYTENKRLLQGPFEAPFKYNKVLEATLFDRKARIVIEMRNSVWKKAVFGGPNFDTSIQEVIKRFSQSPSSLVFHYRDTMTVWSPVFLGETFASTDPLFHTGDFVRGSDESIGYVRMTLGKEHLKKELRNTLIKSLGLGLIFLMAGAVIALLLTKQISRPIKQLVEGVQKYGVDGKCGPLPLTTPNEIGGLANAFHEMTYSIRNHIQSQIDTTKALAHAKNLAELGMASSKVTHEVGNLLNNMELVILALRSEPLSKQGERRLEILEKEADRVKKFIFDFLQFARKPAIQTQKMPMDLIIKENLASLKCQAEACDIGFKLDWVSTLPPIALDRQMIHIAITNLLRNSMEAIGNCGTIKISGQSTRRAPKETLIVTIEDNGPGIETEILEQLFQPFFTTKGNKGTGLGLSIVQGIVQAHGGTITCYSAPGKGAQFIMELPIR
jgi:signal transduction histidine kinase